jgi:CheY-like chemotaxis protein/HPt (histidine-containing phosphotransfer) domain-containing protein
MVKSEYRRGSVFTAQIRQQIVDPAPIGKGIAETIQQGCFSKKSLDGNRNLIRSYMPYGRVLVVDDVETNLDVVKGLLLPYGLAIDCASSGGEAIEKIKALETDPGAKKYDALFMDHMMPEMDGIEAVRIIRNEIGSDYARTVPIIALTANVLKGNGDMFLSRGFNAYLTKPIDILKLDAALNTWVRNRQTQETLDQARLKAEAGEGLRKPPAMSVWALPDHAGPFPGGIDLMEARERYGSEAVFLDILRSYCAHTPALLEKLRCFSRDGMKQYAIAVHGLKGSSYGVCAKALGDFAAALEEAAEEGDFETVEEKNGELIEAAETLVAVLKGLLAKMEKSNGKKQRCDAPDSALLDRVLEASKQYRQDLMEEAIAELEKHEYDSDGELVLWLREQFDNLEYDDIQERLENRCRNEGETGGHDSIILLEGEGYGR